MSDYLLEVENLKVHFPVGRGFHKNKKILKAVDGVSFRLKEGETLGIVGESGCGKSTCGNSIIRLLTPTEGRILFEGKDLAQMSQKELRGLRRDIQMIFQDPFSSLNPRMRVKNIIAEPLDVHKICPKEDWNARYGADGMLSACRGNMLTAIPTNFQADRGRESGIARALALRPKLIICDEPVSALDVSIQAQILNLLSDLQKQFHLTYIFIAHGLPTVQHISSQVAVMYLGKIVEQADKTTLFSRPMHPYTEGLMAAVPIPDPDLRTDDGPLLEGDMPSPTNLPQGCRFHPRCKYCQEKCLTQSPELQDAGGGHLVACHYPLAQARGILR